MIIKNNSKLIILEGELSKQRSVFYLLPSFSWDKSEKKVYSFGICFVGLIVKTIIVLLELYHYSLIKNFFHKGLLYRGYKCNKKICTYILLLRGYL